MIYVQFSDDTDTKIISLFGSPQNEDVYPNQGTVELSDPRYAEYYNSMPEMSQTWWPAPIA